MSREQMIADFLRRHGWDDAERGLLAADASFRRYDRLIREGGSAVLMDAPPPKETVLPFLRIARHLTAQGFSAPCVLGEDVERGFLLLEDLGDNTYTRLLAAGADEADLYRLGCEVLIALRPCPVPPDVAPYDLQKLLDEVALLTDWYMKAVGAPLTEAAREAYFAAWRAVLPAALEVPTCLVLRDFHVDNLMRLDGRDGIGACGLLDFQDALIGPVTYDLVSLFEDARRDVSDAVRQAGRDRYLSAYPDLDPVPFDASWAILAAQRHAKVIGIFTRLSRRDGKHGYLRHMDRLWRLFARALRHPALGPVAAWCDDHLPQDLRVTPPAPATPQNSP